MKNIWRLFQKESGFSLVEVMIALVIIALIATAIVPLFISGFSGIVASGRKSVSMYETQVELERAISQGIQEPDESPLAIIFADSSSVEVRGKQLDVEIEKVSITVFIPGS